MAVGINVLIILLVLGMTYVLTSEGLWGACLMFFNLLFAGMIAFNFYEPLAKLIAENVPAFLAGFADVVCLFGLLIVSLFTLRIVTEMLAPGMVRFPAPIYHLGRLGFGAAAAALTLALLILGFDTAPVHKKVFGAIDYKAMVPFGLGFERKWLAFFQYSTGQIFVTHSPNTGDPFGQFGNAKVFDPRAEWLLNHQEARPFGTESILSEGEAGGAAPAPAQGGGQGEPAGGAPAAAGGAKPGDPAIVGPAVGGGVVLPQ
jgi:hypothetical protein